MSPEDFRKLCDERGIKIPSTGAGYEQLVKSPDSIIYRAKIYRREICYVRMDSP